MTASAEYVEYIKDLLSGFTDLRTKKYFGGVAFRSDQLGVDTQFAVVLNDVLYFVVDDNSRPNYIAKGMQPFRYDKKSGTVEVKKWYAAPEDLFDDAELMQEWAEEALSVAVRL
ncbi:MAG: TfoX/Sxy family protein [Cocleimonas sp.]